MILSSGQLIVFLLILARIAGLFIQAPIISSKAIPFALKTPLAIWITFVLWFTVPVSPVLPSTTVLFVMALVSEVCLGFLIGFICNLLILAIQSAGEIVDMQMGLSVATALDPVFGSTISIIGRLFFNTALIIFLILNGHHLLFAALHQSFSTIPVGQPINIFNPALQSQFIEIARHFWHTTFMLAIPAVLFIFISDFCFGIVSRVAPQVNVFMLGFQVKPSLGMLAILLCLPLIVKHIANLLSITGEQLLQLIIILK
ncbi:MAG: flagellar biosynthetic protein FliR [Candidatus Saganbacteria bacterium]|nr:flagellar biosynthetic protein FliR [Candidatus Saganbacteria bacterium]